MSIPHVEVMRQAARYYGLSFTKFDKRGRIHIISNGKKDYMINRSATEFSSRIGYMLAGNKQSTNQILEQFGYSVPKQKEFVSYSDVLSFYKKHKPIVIKPLDSSLGHGVTVDINSLSKLRKAYKFAKQYSSRILAEQFIVGDDYRVTVINYKHVYVVQRIPAHVYGDGKSRITKLIDQKNKIKKTYKVDIAKDDRSKKTLAEQGYKLSSIPEKGQIAFLRKAANVSDGGTCVEVTPQISKELAQMCIDVSKVMKLPTSGIDIITKDIKGNKATIIEVNFRPHLVIHHDPHIGKKTYPARALVKMMFPTAKKSL